MLRFLRIYTLVIIASGLCLAGSASAHHFWIDQEGNEFVVKRGMFSERIDTYDTSCVKEVKAYGKDGSVLEISRNDKADQVRFSTSTEPSMAVATSEWGYRVMTTEGKKFLTRKQALSKGLTVINAFFSTQFVKTIFLPDGPFEQPVGQKFEMVPVQNPLAKTDSDTFQVQLLYDGEPLSGAPIFIPNGEKMSTDEKGMARIPFSKDKPLLIYSKHWVEAKDRTDIDRIVFRTFLTVEPYR